MKKLLWLAAFLVIANLSFAQTGNFRSLGTGPWTTPGTWERDADSNGSFEESPSTVSPTSVSGTVTIRNTHTVNISSSISIDQVVVQSGGTLVVDATFTATLGTGGGDDINVNSGGVLNVNGIINLVVGIGGAGNRLRVSGTLNNNGTFQNSAITKFIFEAGSAYNHLFDGTAANAIPTAGYNATSTVTISGFGAGGTFAPSGLGQSFGNFVWNTPLMDGFIDLAGLTTVNGNFQVDDTGSGGFYINQAGATPTLTVLGNFNVNGGLFGFIGSTGANGNLTISGDLNMTNGYFQIAEDVDATVDLAGDLIVSGGTLEFSAVSAIVDLNLEGNFSFSGGDLVTSAGTGNINFDNTTTTQVVTSTLVPTGPINYTVSSLSTLNIPGSNFLSGGSTGSMNVSGMLQLGSTVASGALQTGTTNGNVRIPTANRTYQAGSTIVYNGSGAQFIGNGFPSGGGNVNLTINNSSGVTLSTNLSIVALGTLNLMSGNLSIGTQTLTINGTVIGSGGIVGGPSSNLVIGGTGNFGTLNFAGTNQLLNFTLNRTSSGLVTLGGDLTTLGTFTQTAGDLSLNGNDLTVSGAFARTAGNIVVHSASSFIVDGSGALPASVGFSGTTLNTLTLDRSSVTLTTSASITVTNLNLIDGTLSNGAGFAIANAGTITRNAGSMTTSPTSSGTYNILYNVSGTINSGNEFSAVTTRIQNVTMDGGGTVNLTANRTINGNLTLTSGDFNIASTTITLEGNLVANSSSSFTSGTFVFDGSTTVSGSAIPTFGNIQVNDTRILTLPAGDFEVAGNISFEAGATVNAGSSTFVLNGSSLQTFSGGGITLGNVTVNKSGGTDVDLTSQLIITGSLEVSSANSDFGSNGNLVIRSTSDGTSGNGRIGQLLNGASVSGDVTVERFMASEGRIYRYISTPVAGFAVSQLQLDLPITGSFTGTSSCSGCTTNQSMFSYDGSTQAYVDFPSTANTEILQPGVGYSTFVRQDILGGPVTIDWSGPINQGTVPLPVSHNGTSTSYNLVGNPYPSTIDWDNAGWTKSGISNAIQVRDNTTGVFRTWNGSTGDLTGGRIATGQGFWVRTTAGSPSLQVTEPVKSTLTGTFFRKEEEPLNQIVLTLANASGSIEDNAFYWIGENTSMGLDDWDAIKQNNFKDDGVKVFDLGTYSFGDGSMPMSINAVNMLSCSDVIRIYTNDLTAGNFTLRFRAEGTMEGLTWMLKDKFSGASIDLRQQPEYTFTVTADAASAAIDRFYMYVVYEAAEISTHGNTLISNYELGNKWYLNGTLLENETGKELEAKESGLYTLVVSASGCETSVETDFIVTSAETDFNDLISVYPNPIQRNHSSLQIEVMAGTEVKVDFTNTLQQGVNRNVEMTRTDRGYSGSVDMTSVPAGVYILKIQSGSNTVYRKIVKN